MFIQLFPKINECLADRELWNLIVAIGDQVLNTETCFLDDASLSYIEGVLALLVQLAELMPEERSRIWQIIFEYAPDFFFQHRAFTHACLQRALTDLDSPDVLGAAASLLTAHNDIPEEFVRYRQDCLRAAVALVNSQEIANEKLQDLQDPVQRIVAAAQADAVKLLSERAISAGTLFVARMLNPAEYPELFVHLTTQLLAAPPGDPASALRFLHFVVSQDWVASFLPQVLEFALQSVGAVARLPSAVLKTCVIAHTSGVLGVYAQLRDALLPRLDSLQPQVAHGDGSTVGDLEAIAMARSTGAFLSLTFGRSGCTSLRLSARVSCCRMRGFRTCSPAWSTTQSSCSGSSTRGLCQNGSTPAFRRTSSTRPTSPSLSCSTTGRRRWSLRVSQD
jgi:hypothetical protein